MTADRTINASIDLELHILIDRRYQETYTTGWQTLKLSDSSEGECADGDHGCGLHLDDWYGEILSWEID